MLDSRELKVFRRSLLNWFREFRRDLPWRRTKDPYLVWVSEIMLQQTRVAAVIPYFQRFVQRFPNVRALAEAPPDEVLRYWSGLGYYSRARNLHRAAQKIAELHDGTFPPQEADLRALPGIGNYTAAAVCSIAFGAKRAVLDGNVARVLARLGAIRGNVREVGRWQRLAKQAQALLDPITPGDWNQSMMELGAIVCTPRAPQCLLCPVAKFCEARKSGAPDAFPEKQKKRESVEVILAAAVVQTPSGKTLLLPPPPKKNAQRAPEDVATLVSGLWHFPTVAVRGKAQDELQSYLLRLTSQHSTIRSEPLNKVRHSVTYRKVVVLPFRIALASEPRISGARTIRLQNLSELPISNLTRKIASVALGDKRPLADKLEKRGIS
ncbi:MAG TPA: A/G-specific adenine glycosylase [Candidatus Acidoferrum sp.]|nr:A/G-specific adenine glycosylase [Candidatus Acidoferrum sp.]